MASVATAASLIVVVIAAVVAFRQVVESARTRQVESLVTVMSSFDSSELRGVRSRVRADSEVLSRLAETHGLSAVRQRLTDIGVDEIDSVRLRTDLGQMEFMSALLLHGHFPSSLERDYVGPLLRESWVAFGPIVTAVRHSGPGTHVYLRHLAAVADLTARGKLKHRYLRRRAICQMRRDERKFTRKVRSELSDIPAVIFIVGLPGSGKSLVRVGLAEQLEHLGASVVQQTDYPYLFQSFLEARLGLAPARGFAARSFGLFELKDAQKLETSFAKFADEVTRLRELDERVLADFARKQNLPILRDVTRDLAGDLAVVHVSAHESLRKSRLRRRSTVPITTSRMVRASGSTAATTLRICAYMSGRRRN